MLSAAETLNTCGALWEMVAWCRACFWLGGELKFCAWPQSQIHDWYGHHFWDCSNFLIFERRKGLLWQPIKAQTFLTRLMARNPFRLDLFSRKWQENSTFPEWSASFPFGAYWCRNATGGTKLQNNDLPLIDAPQNTCNATVYVRVHQGRACLQCCAHWHIYLIESKHCVTKLHGTENNAAFFWQRHLFHDLTHINSDHAFFFFYTPSLPCSIRVRKSPYALGRALLVRNAKLVHQCERLRVPEMVLMVRQAIRDL